MSIILAIILLIVLAIIDNSDKEKERKPIIIGYKPGSGEPVFNKEFNEKPIGYDIHTGAPIYESDRKEEKKIEPPKVKTEEDKQRTINSLLMITGAILIVFASIIFLVTSWEVLDGIIKTLILVAIQIVFYIFSVICDKTFNIPKTSKVFKYLSLVFVPIVLLSLSCFEIIGDYLSIGGDGVLLYFGLAFILSDIIFKVINYIEKDKIIGGVSHLLENLGVLFVAEHFLPEDAWSLLILSVYNLVYYALIAKNIVNKEYYLGVNHAINYVNVAILLLLLSINGPEYSVNASLFVNALYYFVKYLFNDNDMKQRRYIIYFLGLYIASLTILRIIEIPPYFVYILALIPLLLLTIVIKKNHLKDALLYGIMIFSILIIGRALFDIIIDSKEVIGNEIYYLLTFISAFILYVITYIISKKGLAKILAYSAFTLIFMEILKMTELEELNKYILLVTIVLVYFLEVLFERLKDKNTEFYIPALIIIESIVLIQNYAVLVPLLFMIIYIKLEHKEEALLIVPMLMSLSIFTMEDSTTSRIISYVLLGIYSLLSITKKDFNIYTVISFIAIFYADAVFEIHPITFSAVLTLWSIAHLIINNYQKFFKFATITSVLLLYINIIRTLELDMIAPYLFGAYLYLISLTRYLFKEKVEELKPLECIGIAFITIFGITRLVGPSDAVILIFSLLIISIVGFVMKWNHITYTGLICLIINIIVLTVEYWSQIPWYVYILIVGLALIAFAMFDEKRKLNKKKKEQEQVTNVDTK